jgi:hypothetical protein
MAGALASPALAQWTMRNAGTSIAQGALRRNPDGAGRRPTIEADVERFYVNQFRRQVEMSDDQFGKALPMLRLALRERREIQARRIRALNQLRQAVERGDGDEELKLNIDEVDKVNAELKASQDRFLRGVDPILSLRQQARLRIFEIMIEQRIRRMIDQARVPSSEP